MKKWNLKKILVVFKEEASHPSHHETHYSSLKKICKVLDQYPLRYRVIRRENLRKKIREELVITVGGDGTFLHASHFADAKHLLLGVNSVPYASHGAFCYTNAQNFEKIFPKVLQHQVPVTPLYRLQAKKNKKALPFLALNDILFANPSPAGTSRYQIQYRRKQENQKSSGIWISTPSGSSAAIRSAGGLLLPKHSRQFQFRIREAFQQGKKKLKILKGILSAKEKLILIPQMSRGTLFIDGSHLHCNLKYGDTVEISLSREVVWAVMR